MAKSKYPNKLDTSLEIPAVRDNIIEVGSDVLNSLRSAIFNIERTLGVNPQGAVGNTVASRINNALDGNGNIVKEALDKANLLSGPIKNLDVSKSAGIEESKLKLNFPTNLLQSEISQIIKEIDIITKTLEDLAYLFAAHTHPAAKNRHMAQAISVDDIPVISSDLGMISTEKKTAQEFYESLFSSHINFTGSGISKTNRSHKADQIFFDKDPVSAYVASDDVQGAIVDTLSQTLGQLEGHQNLHHSNGILRSSLNSNSSFENVGESIVLDEEVLFFKSSPGEPEKVSNISFVDNPELPLQGLRKSDIVRIFSEDGTHKDFQLHSFSKTVDGLGLDNIRVFGSFERNSLATDRVSIFRNENTSDDASGLMATARPYPDKVNLELIQIANPNAPKIITNGLRPSEISATNRYFKILIDESKLVSIDVYNPSDKQDIGTIVSAINKDLCSAGASVLAYRVDFDDDRHSEIAFAHSLSASATENISLKIKEADTDDCLESMGLHAVRDILVKEGSSAQFYIKGRAYSGLRTKLSQTGLVLISGTSSISSQAIGLDFKEQGLCEGDLIIISGTDSDDGTYVITDVSSTTLTVDRDQLDGKAWSGVEGQESVFRVLANTVSLSAFRFYKPTGAPGSGAIVDLFLDSDNNIFYNTRLEYPAKTFGASGSLISPCNFKGNISEYTIDSPGIISVDLNLDNLPQIALDDGPSVVLASMFDSYIDINSGKYNLSIRIYVENSDNIFSKLDNEGSFQVELYGDEQVNVEENLLITRAVFDSGRSRLIGGKQNSARFFSLIERGTTSSRDLSTKALEKTYQTPFSDTRSNGVVEGLKIIVPEVWEVDGKYAINLTGGVCYVKGKRFSIDKKTDLVSGINKVDADKVFIAINEWGEVVFGGANSSGGTVACSSPFNSDSHCILSCLEYAAPNIPSAIDLRLIIKNLDIKVLNPITVSPKKGMGHFQSFGEAIKYAKRFVDVFPEAGTPTVHLKAGLHRVPINVEVDISDYDFVQHYAQAAYDAGVYINFPINIVGEGDSTVLDIYTEFSDQSISLDDRLDAGYTDHTGFLFVAGSGVVGVDGDTSTHDDGLVSFSNFRTNLTPICLMDPLLKDDDGNLLNAIVSCDNITFDFSKKSGFGQWNNGIVIYKSNNSAAGDEVGGLTIRNCNFIRSNINMGNFNDSSHKNILVYGNSFRGSGIGGNDTNLYAFFGISAFSFDSVPAENNFEVRANLLAGDLDNANLADSGRLTSAGGLWSDRLSSSLRVGRSISLGGSGTLFSGNRSYGLTLNGEDHNNGIYVTKGTIKVKEGDLSLDKGKLHINGHSGGTDITLDGETGGVSLTAGSLGMNSGDINMEGGSINMANGGIVLDKGNLSATGVILTEDGGSAEFEATTITNDTENNYSHFKGVLRRADGQEPRKDDQLGATVLAGNSATGGTRYGALIQAYAHEDWSPGNRDSRLEIKTRSGDNWETTGCLKVMPDGQVQIKGGGAVLDDELTGALIISHSDPASGHSISIGSGSIQAKSNAATVDLLSLNHKGGGVRVGTPLAQDGSLDDYVTNGSALYVHNADDEGSSDPTIIASNWTEVQDKWTSCLDLKYRRITSAELNNKNGFIRFRGQTPGTFSDTQTIGHIHASGGSITYAPFTGQHLCPVRDPEDIDLFSKKESVGLIVVSDGRPLLGGSSTETFVGAKVSSFEKQKTVCGVLAETILSPHEDNWTGGWTPEDKAIYINALGNGRVWVTNISGNIDNGDFICTSNIPGLGQLQDDGCLMNYTVAKSTESVDWNSISDTITYNGIEYKKYLIACTYHCG